MTAAGWIVMLLSVGGATAFFAWTLTLTLTRPREDVEHMHSTRDEPPDIEDD